MPQKRVMIIEDEPQIARLIELELRHAAYEPVVKKDGEQGLKDLPLVKPDLILLDLMLPGIDGLEVCRKIRELSQVPIIMLTAKDGTLDKVTGLDAGANDYLTKPFEMIELLARMRAALRGGEPYEQAPPMLCVGDVVIDQLKHTVNRGGTPILLTRKEFELLEYLVKNKDIVLSRAQILDNVWGIDYNGEANIVDVYIKYLRDKIDQPFHSKLIRTVRGYGYVLEGKKAHT